MHIKTHLDTEHGKKLEQLIKWTNLSVSRVIEQAIDFLHAHRITEPKRKILALLASGFIGCGCGRGPENLSMDYKNYLARDLAENLVPTDSGYRLVPAIGSEKTKDMSYNSLPDWCHIQFSDMPHKSGRCYATGCYNSR